jgi:hypothetical protein
MYGLGFRVVMSGNLLWKISSIQHCWESSVINLYVLLTQSLHQWPQLWLNSVLIPSSTRLSWVFVREILLLPIGGI